MTLQLSKKQGFNPSGWDAVRIEAITKEDKLYNTSSAAYKKEVTSYLLKCPSEGKIKHGWHWFRSYEDPFCKTEQSRGRIGPRPNWEINHQAGDFKSIKKQNITQCPVHLKGTTTKLLHKEKSLPDLKRRPYAPYMPDHLRRGDPGEPEIPWTFGPYNQKIRHPSLPNGYFNNETLHDWVARNPKK